MFKNIIIASYPTTRIKKKKKIRTRGPRAMGTLNQKNKIKKIKVVIIHVKEYLNTFIE